MTTQLLSAFILLVSLTSVVLAQDPAKQIEALTADVEKQLANSPERLKHCANEIANVRSQLKHEHSLLALYTIQGCYIDLSSLSAASRTGLLNKDDAAFDEEWKKTGVYLSEKDKGLSERASKPKPAIITALSEISVMEGKQSYEISRTLWKSGNRREAIDSLGRATASFDFGVLSRQLHFPEPKSVLKLVSVGPALSKLETIAMRTYKSADATPQHPEFIRLSSTLKLATDLNRFSMYEGALLKYLELQLDFGLLVTAAEREDVEHLRQRNSEMGKRLKSGKADNSIALLFWQISSEALNPRESSEPTQDGVKRASVVLNRVLPSYFDYIKELPKDDQ